MARYRRRNHPDDVVQAVRIDSVAKVGDWMVTYANGSTGLCTHRFFDDNYEPVPSRRVEFCPICPGSNVPMVLGEDGTCSTCGYPNHDAVRLLVDSAHLTRQEALVCHPGPMPPSRAKCVGELATDALRKVGMNVGFPAGTGAATDILDFIVALSKILDEVEAPGLTFHGAHYLAMARVLRKVLAAVESIEPDIQGSLVIGVSSIYNAISCGLDTEGGAAHDVGSELTVSSDVTAPSGESPTPGSRNEPGGVFSESEGSDRR